MAKTKKTPRPRAETPKGFRDYFGADVTERKDMLDAIAQVYHAHGFDPLESAAVETVQALGKFLPDVDRPNDGVFAWQEDDDGDWLALRYDLTAPLARVYAQHRNDLPTPYRRYAMGPVWRNEKPGPGRFRQFYQCDADTVGTASQGVASVAADAEMCMMLADVLEAVGIDRDDYVIRVYNRKILNGLLEEAELPAEAERQRGIVVRAIDKLDRLKPEGVRALLGEGRKDESGDFTEGASLNDDQIRKILYFLNIENTMSDTAERMVPERPTEFELTSDNFEPSRGGQNPNYDTLNRLKSWFQYSVEGLEGVRELYELAELFFKAGYYSDRIIIDPSVVRGLGYYTGPVFEAELTFEVADEKGRSRQFGSVEIGGRYDDLVKRFTGQAVPATGISIGVDRLLAALRAKNENAGKDATGPVVVTVMDRDRMAEYQQMAADLRKPKDGGEPIRAEVYLGNPKNFGNQLKYADKRGSPIAVIQGSDEAARGVVQIKDLILGAKIAETATHEEWRDQPAQFEVPRAEMVAKVREILDRQ